jgi:MFS family permease
MGSRTTKAVAGKERKLLGVVPNVFFLGLVSMLTDVSSEMIFTLVPLFLSNVLGASMTIIGFVGGFTDAVDAVVRIPSGWISDKSGRRKLLAVLGYGFSAFCKPFMYFAGAWGAVLGVRFGDRIGKGIRSSPRDALIADSAPASERGRSFGLHRAMDTAGAFLGLALAAVIIYAVEGTSAVTMNLGTFRWLVIYGTVPAIIGVLILVVLVKETKKQATIAAPGVAPIQKSSARFDRRFYIFLTIVAIFTLGNSSDFFLILRAQKLAVPLLQVTLMLLLFNAVYVAVSYPMGVLSDRIGRRTVIIAGWLVYGLTYLGFALATTEWQAWALFAVYGIYYGMVEGNAKAFIADLVPAERRGRAYGLFQGIVGLMILPASVIAGWLWSAISPSATFYFGGALALLAMLGMLLLIRENRTADNQLG